MITFREVRIGDTGRVVTGKTPPSAKPECFGMDYPFITPTDIRNDLRTVTTERGLSEVGRAYQPSLLLPPEAVCVVCIGSIGKICMNEVPSFTNQQINSIIVDRVQYNPRFIYYMFILTSRFCIRINDRCIW